MKIQNKFLNKVTKGSIIIGAALLVCFSTLYVSVGASKVAYANHVCCPCGTTCKPNVQAGCSVSACECQSTKETGDPSKPKTSMGHITKEFIQHREWIIKIFWEAHILPAMMLMTEQMTTASLQQMLMVGTLFDAKHQIETQQLLQEMQAKAHKDYQPSKGMCEFGTNTKSLAASARNASFTQTALATRAVKRQLLSGDGISAGEARDDANSRLDQFKTTYCNPKDFGNQLDLLCDGSKPKRYNKDVNYTQTIDSVQTLEIDFTKPSSPADDKDADIEDVLALSANLYGHKIMPRIPEEKLIDPKTKALLVGSDVYMKIRALTAKRSVAQSAFAAQAAMRSQGGEEVFPYMEAILKEMGIPEAEVKEMIGERPSYYAQMELLTKKLYQTPEFYTDLYDKPTNIDRKNASMQAIGLMQRRDMYHSQLRNEAMAAVLLEASLEDLESLYVNETNPMKANSRPLDLPGLE